MEDEQIIALYLARSENAIAETQKKYGGYCKWIAETILPIHEDAEECVSDALLRTWEAIPPHHPENLKGFLGKIVRNLALNRLKKIQTAKRGGGQLDLILSELEQCIPAPDNVETETDERLLTALLNRFLSEQPSQKRIIFVRRYFYASSLNAIAADLGMSLSKVKSILFRMRNDLKNRLKREGIWNEE